MPEKRKTPNKMGEAVEERDARSIIGIEDNIQRLTTDRLQWEAVERDARSIVIEENI
jgi:hypothetical protein